MFPFAHTLCLFPFLIIVCLLVLDYEKNIIVPVDTMLNSFM